MDYIYGAKIEADPEGGFLVTFPDVPEAITSGETMAEARASGAEALGLALRGVAAMGRPLPKPQSADQGLVSIAVAPDTALKLAVVEAFAQSGISKRELARRLNKAETEARRILDPDHPTKLPVLQATLALLGKEIVVSVRDAA
ncbi:type II toxin-antitoxin system HicB family antitoxin [Aminobacter sp. HY435]|uniref:type II toxin-antitoxin system HicB family antitoxin n=1 Tax=Aminobacter sp. HY435 TaxID=2970917 RepID=UPI0022B96C41|nr:type II toxin-antitoxin system HicB family antitoxin [Aminobacter sp. HY435]